jgi:hypothetical protein
MALALSGDSSVGAVVLGGTTAINA